MPVVQGEQRISGKFFLSFCKTMFFYTTNRLDKLCSLYLYIYILIYKYIKEVALLTERDLKLYQLKAELCKTFSDPTRLIIINQLRHGEKTVGELVQLLETPQAVVSRHLAILRDRGVVDSRRAGTSVYYRLTDSKIIEACDLVHGILLSRIEKNRELADRLIV